jgi:hypothetical protein
MYYIDIMHFLEGIKAAAVDPNTPAGAKREARGEEGAATMAAGTAGSGLAPSQRNIVIVGRIFYQFF